MSGQHIKFQKSFLQFGHKVTEEIRVEIQQVFGIITIGGMSSYLGIPESFGGSKTQIFGFLNEMINSKVNSWTVRFIRKGGKEVLIKYVASAMSNHVMSCYRLPKTVTKKIMSVTAHF